ncbi:MAG: 4Fe-4S double cluster binding domain-containing protein [Negativicutes bacterium]|nr:4Fe-4S double cluster binding domain-containing protein [Negativicutes bacterium]
MGDLENRIKAKALECGYDGCGIIAAGGFDEFSAELDRRSALFPQAAPFYNGLRRLAKPGECLDWAKSVVVCRRRYDDKYRIPGGLERYVGKVYLVDGRLSYSREAAGNAALSSFLEEQGMRTAQNAVPHRWSAVRAGLGKFRDNNFVYTERGSWNWFETWVVDKELEYEPPVVTPRLACPEGCGKCIKACPTGALSAPLTMDASRCIAYLSFRPGVFPAADLREKMGTWLYGCDLCQNVCPANAKTWQDNDEHFPDPVSLEKVVTPEAIIAMDEAAFREVLQPRFWYIGEDDIWQWKSNAIRALANMEPEKYREQLSRFLDDSDERVREMAAWALAKSR